MFFGIMMPPSQDSTEQSPDDKHHFVEVADKFVPIEEDEPPTPAPVPTSRAIPSRAIPSRVNPSRNIQLFTPSYFPDSVVSRANRIFMSIEDSLPEDIFNEVDLPGVWQNCLMQVFEQLPCGCLNGALCGHAYSIYGSDCEYDGESDYYNMFYDTDDLDDLSVQYPETLSFPIKQNIHYQKLASRSKRELAKVKNDAGVPQKLKKQYPQKTVPKNPRRNRQELRSAARALKYA